MPISLRWILVPVVAFASPVLGQEPAAPPLPAQPPPQPQAELVVPSGTHMGGWGGPTVAYGRVNGQDAVFVGGRGAWLVAHRFGIGGGAVGLTNQVDGPPVDGAATEIRMEYGGLWLETAFAPLRMAHLTAGVLVGGGTVKLAPRGQDNSVATDGFFVAEPTLSLEVNLGRAVRLDLGATYRWVNGIDQAGLGDADLSGPTAVAVVKFGSF